MWEPNLRIHLENVNDNSTQYKHEVTAARVERRHPYVSDINSSCTLEREELILKEIKRRDNKRVNARSFKKMGRQIRGHVKTSSLKKTSLTRLELQDATWIWKHIQVNELIEEHITQRNMEQFLHAGNTPFGYTPLWEDSGHNGDIQMAEDILAAALEHKSLRDETIQAILKQLRQHPVIQQIFKPIIAVETSSRHSNAYQRRQLRPTQEGATIIINHAQKVQAMDWQTHKQVYMPPSCLPHYSEDIVREDGNTS
jgi:hypothetical protein